MKRTNNNHCDWVKQMLKDPDVRTLTRSEEYALWPLAKAGDERAKIRLLKSQWALVTNIAKKYLWTGTDLEDLISMGMTGLMKAFNKFDPSLGNRFSTVAFQWIRQALSIDSKQAQFSVDMPNHLLSPRGRKRAKMTKEEFEALKRRFNRGISLEHKLASIDHESPEFSGLIVVEPDLLEIESRETIQAVKDAIKTLPKDDQKIVKLRLQGMTFREIKKHINCSISPQRLHQRFNNACEKIRAWIEKHRPGLVH